MHRNGLVVTWLFALNGLWAVFLGGQVYMGLLLPCVCAWLLLRKGHYLSAGILIGLVVAIKPNFAIWPLLFILAGYWRPALSSLASSAALSLPPALVYGPDIYLKWLAVTGPDLKVLLPTNGSLLGFFSRFDVPLLGLLADAILLVILAFLVRRHRPDILSVSAIALAASLLLSLLAWEGYTLLLLPIFLSRRWDLRLLVAAIIMVVPNPAFHFLSGFSRQYLPIIGAFYPLALTLVLLTTIKQMIPRFAPVTLPRLHSVSGK